MTTRLLRTLTLLCVGLAGCSSNGTTTSPTTTDTATTSPVTMTFASRVAPGGSTSRAFTANNAGTITLTLGSFGSGEAVGLGIGIPPGGTTPCSLAQSVVTVAGSAPQMSVPVEKGTYCVQLFDVGTIAGETPFSMTIVYP